MPDYLKVLKYAPREYAQGPVHVLLDVRVSCLIGIKSSKYPYGMVVRFGRPRVSRRKKTPGGAGTHTGRTGAHGYTDHTDEPPRKPKPESVFERVGGPVSHPTGVLVVKSHLKRLSEIISDRDDDHLSRLNGTSQVFNCFHEGS